MGKALVIGGSGALGRTVCRVLVEKGFDLGFTFCRNEQLAQSLATELKARAYKMNLNDVDEVRSVLRTVIADLDGIDALVVSSGLATAHAVEGKPVVPQFMELEPAGFDTMMNVNVRGVVFACQAVARSMIDKGSGRIVLVGSIDGVKPMPAPPDYACCKAALWGVTQSISKELGKYNILVNMVAPGILEGGVADLLSEELMAAYLKHSALRRVGSFREAANAIAYLVSEKNTYLTGQAMVLDGGL